MSGVDMNHLFKIDVLKAMAITLVFFYHLFPDVFISGFVGVDIFLVVTGYLTAMALSRRSCYEFLVGRFWRIYPSLSVMLVFMLAFILAVGYSNEIRNIVKYFISSSLLMTNIHLYMDSGYFSEGIYSNLFFHLWSIALEVQLWVIIALVITLGGIRVGRALFVVSFFGTVYVLAAGNIDDFYLNPLLRFWQAWLGYETFLTRYKLPMNKKTLLLISIVFVFLLLCFFDLKENITLWVLSPFLCVLVMLLEFDTHTIFRRVVRSISGRTYAYYLWHVPVIVICTFYFLLNGVIRIMAVVVITALFAELSYRLLELRRI